MGKAAATKKTTTAEDSAQIYINAFDAKNQFFAATLGMGWRLAITVLIPMVIGIQVDKHFNSSPSYTLTGFMIAVVGAVIVVKDSVKQVNAEQAEMDAEAKKTTKKKGTPK